MLGWEPQRALCMQLADAVHDEVLTARRGVPCNMGRLLANVQGVDAELAAQLDETELLVALKLWSNDGDDYRPGSAQPKWHQVAVLCSQIGLGAPSAEDLQEDWEIWISMAEASLPRLALLETLAQSERAASDLARITKGAPMTALVNATRMLWASVAYGDPRTTQHIQTASEAWLAQVPNAANQRPGRS